TCPSCDASYAVDDDKRGAKVRCRKCKEVISVPAGKSKRRDEEAVQAGSKLKVKPATRSRRDDDDDDEDRRPTPRRKEAAAKGGGGAMMLVVVGGVGVLLGCGVGVGGIGGFCAWRSRAGRAGEAELQAREEVKKQEENGPGKKAPDDQGQKNPIDKNPIDKNPIDKNPIDKNPVDPGKPLPPELPANQVPRIKQS